MIKAAPRGFAHRTEEASSQSEHDSDDTKDTHTVDMVSRSRVTANWVSLVCGGIGHASNVDGMQCLTAQLGIKVPKEVLKQVEYPSGIIVPGSRTDNPKRANAVQTRKRDKDKPRPRQGKGRREQARLADTPEPEDKPDDESQSSDNEQVKLAVDLKHVDIRRGYVSHDESSESDLEPPPRSSRKSKRDVGKI